MTIATPRAPGLIAPLVPTRSEPGRAAPPDEIDENRQHQYVYMVRDLGTRRQPATVLGIGGTLIFLGLCWILHRRDTVVARNTSSSSSGATPVPAAGQ